MRDVFTLRWDETGALVKLTLALALSEVVEVADWRQWRLVKIVHALGDRTGCGCDHGHYRSIATCETKTKTPCQTRL